MDATGQEPERAAGTDPLVKRAALALASVSHGERRLRLGGREVAGLAPLAAEWLASGASIETLREALTSGLPKVVHCPEKLVGYQLVKKLPETPSFAALRAAEAASRPVEPRVAGMRECVGDWHTQPLLFRPVVDELLCPDSAGG